VNLYQFLSDSPMLTFFLAYLLTSFFESVIKRTIRHFDIKKNGWPPNHCDADGDFKEEKDAD